MTTSRPLIEQLLAGEAEAFDAFYERYFAPIYWFSRARSTGRGQAECLCRTLFESVLARLPESAGNDSPDAWVLRIVSEAFERNVRSHSHGLERTRLAPVVAEG